MATSPYLKATPQQQSDLLQLDTRQWGGLKDSSLGLDSASAAEVDARTLSPWQLREKYGDQTTNQYLRQALDTTNQEMGRELQGRSSTRAVTDTLVDVGTGVVQGVMGIGSLVTGMGSTAASRAIAEASDSVGEWARGNLQTTYLGTQQDRQQRELALRARDNAYQRDQDVSQGKNATIADLKEFGRNFLDTFASQNLASFTSGTGSALGSTVATIPVIGQVAKAANKIDSVLQTANRVKALNASRASINLTRAADPLAANAMRTAAVEAARAPLNRTLLNNRILQSMPGIAAMELGGTASDIMNQIGSMTHEELLATSPEYNSRYVQSLSEGLSNKHARERARDSLITDATIAGTMASAPAVLAASTLGGWLNRAPNAARNAPRLTARQMARDIGSESLEEFIQNPASQFGSNVAQQQFIDPSVRLTEGLGEAAAEGVLYSLGSTASIQAARKAFETPKAVREYFQSNEGRVQDRKLNRVIKPLNDIAANNPAVAPIVHPQDVVIDTPDTEVQEAVQSSPNFAEALRKVSDEIIQSDDPETQLKYGVALAQLENTIADRLDAFMEGEDFKEGVDEATKNSITEIKAIYDEIRQHPKIVQAASLVQDALNQKIQTPEQISIQEYSAFLQQPDYTRLTQEDIDKHLEASTYLMSQMESAEDVSPVTRKTLEANHVILTALKESEGLFGSQDSWAKVSERALLADNKDWAPSAAQFIRTALTAHNNGDAETRDQALQDLRLFNDHYQNKAQAFIQSYESPKDVGEDISYQSLGMIDRVFRESTERMWETKKVFINKKSETSIKNAQRALAEAQIINSMTRGALAIFSDSVVSSPDLFTIPEALNSSASDIKKRFTQPTGNKNESDTNSADPGSSNARDSVRVPEQASFEFSFQEDTNRPEGTSTSTASDLLDSAVKSIGTRENSGTQESGQQTKEKEKSKSTRTQEKKSSKKSRFNLTAEEGKRETKEASSTPSKRSPSTSQTQAQQEEGKGAEPRTPRFNLNFKEGQSLSSSGNQEAGTRTAQTQEGQTSESGSRSEVTTRETPSGTSQGTTGSRPSRFNLNLPEDSSESSQSGSNKTPTQTSRFNLNVPETVETKTPQEQSNPTSNKVKLTPLKQTKSVGAKEALKVDQKRSDRATKVITSGLPGSVPAHYASLWGDKANSGQYTRGDTVWIKDSIWTSRATNPIGPNVKELQAAIAAKARILTDTPSQRALKKNQYGSRETARLLTEAGYTETTPGTWVWKQPRTPRKAAETPSEVSQTPSEVSVVLTPQESVEQAPETIQSDLEPQQVSGITEETPTQGNQEEPVEIVQTVAETQTEESQETPTKRENPLTQRLTVLRGKGKDAFIPNDQLDTAFSRSENPLRKIPKTLLGEFSFKRLSDYLNAKLKALVPSMEPVQMESGLWDVGLTDQGGLSYWVDESTGQLSDLAKQIAYLVALDVMGNPLHRTGDKNNFWNNTTGIHYNRNKGEKSDFPFLFNGRNTNDLIDRIKSGIKGIIGIRENPDISMKIHHKMLGALALEVFEALKRNGFIESRLIPFLDAEENERLVDFSMIVISKKDQRKIDKIWESARSVVVPDSRKGYGFKPGKYLVRNTVVNSHMPIMDSQLKSMRALAKNTPFIPNPYMEEAIGDTSAELLADLFIEPLHARGLPEYQARIAASRSDILNGIRSYGGILEDMLLQNGEQVFFRYALTQVNRIMMDSPVNPQNNKMLRELLVPGESKFNKNEVPETYYRAILQAFGEKVAKMDTQGVLEAIDRLTPFLDSLPDNLVSLEAKNAFTEAGYEYTPLSLHAALDVRKFREPGDTHTSYLYLEIDGVHNGPFNLGLLFNTDTNSPAFQNILKSGGVSTSQESQVDIYGGSSPHEDLYEKVAKDVSASFQGLDPDTKRAMATILDGLEFDGTDLAFSRSFFKSPLMTAGYGAGDMSITNTIINDIQIKLEEIKNSILTRTVSQETKKEWEEALSFLTERKMKINSQTRLTKDQLYSLRSKIFSYIVEPFRDSFTALLGLNTVHNLVALNKVVVESDKGAPKNFEESYKALEKEQREQGIIEPGESITLAGYRSLLDQYQMQGMGFTSPFANVHFGRIFPDSNNTISQSLRTVTKTAGGKNNTYTASVPYPSATGISYLAKSTIAAGDGTQMMYLADKIKNALLVFDGINLPVGNADTYSALINSSVVPVLETNLYAQLLPRTTEGRDVINNLATIKDAANKSLLKRDLWIDQMGGNNTPYLRIGSEPKVDDVVLDAATINRAIKNPELINILKGLVSLGLPAPTVILVKSSTPHYDSSTHTIRVPDLNESALVHELVHAYTVHAIQKYEAGEELPVHAREAIRNLRSLYKNFQKVAKDNPVLEDLNQRSDGNLSEWIAYSLSEQGYIDELKKIPVWKRIQKALYQFINKLFQLNLPKNFYEEIRFNAFGLGSVAPSESSTNLYNWSPKVTYQLKESLDREMKSILASDYRSSLGDYSKHLKTTLALTEKVYALRQAGFDLDAEEEALFASVYRIMEYGTGAQAIRSNKTLFDLAEDYRGRLGSVSLSEAQRAHLEGLDVPTYLNTFAGLVAASESFRESLINLEGSPSVQVTVNVVDPAVLDPMIEAREPVLSSNPSVGEYLEPSGYQETEPGVYTHPEGAVLLDESDLGKLPSIMASIRGTDQAYARVMKWVTASPERLQMLQSTGYQRLVTNDADLTALLTQVRANARQEPEEEITRTPKTYVETLVKTVLDHFGKQARNGNQQAQEALNDILNIYQTQDKSLILKAESKAQGFKEKADEKVASWLHNASDVLVSKGDKLNRASNNKAVKAVAGATSVLGNLLSDKNTGNLFEALNTLVMAANLPDWVNKLTRDFIGKVDSNADVLSLTKEVKAHTQQLRQLYRKEVPEHIASLLSVSLTPDQWSALTDSLLKTDIASLNEDEVLAALNSPETRQERIAILQQGLSPYQISKAEQLAEYMASGTTGSMLLKNAVEIAQEYGTSKIKDTTPAEIEQIDKLVTYLVLEKPMNHDVVNSLEEADLKKLVRILKSMKTPLGIKGYIPHSATLNTSIQLVPREQWVEYRKGGWIQGEQVFFQKSHNSGSEYAYFTFPTDDQAQYTQGFLQTIHSQTNGILNDSGFIEGMSGPRIVDKAAVRIMHNQMTRSPELFNQVHSFVPVFNNKGKVIAFQGTIDRNQLGIQNPQRQLHNLVGVMKGRTLEEAMSRELNKSSIKRLHEMWKKESKSANQGFYVNLLDPEFKADPVLRDALNNLSASTRKAIQEEYGEENTFWVRKDLIDDALGYRSASVRDIFTGNSRINKTYRLYLNELLDTMWGVHRDKVQRHLALLESNIQDMVSLAKSTIVVRSVVVPIANIKSNILQLAMRGIGAVSMLKYGRKAFQEINEYNKNRKLGLQYQTQLLATDPSEVQKIASLQRKIDLIKERDRRLTIYPLIEAGEYTTIHEGLGNDLTEVKKVGVLNWVENQVDKLPDPYLKGVRTVMLAQGTPIYNFLQKSVQYGDFVAKAVLYMHNEAKGIPRNQSLRQINEEFVDYDMLAGRSRQYIESIGLAWFMNFQLRIQKVALKILQKNPVSTLLSLTTAQGLPVDFDDNILVDSFVGKTLRGTTGYTMGTSMGFSAPSKHALVAAFL